MKKIYVTKYCLTKGIIVHDWDGEIHTDSGLIYPEVEYKTLNPLYLGKEAFESVLDAKIDAENKRAKKIESLKKQISKLEKLNFN